MAHPSARATRRVRAVESFRRAGDCIGEITEGSSIFAITSGQWSMIDAVMYCLDSVGPAELSVWTWTVAEYEIECMERLMRDGAITKGTLIIDHGARNKNIGIIRQWRSMFGAESVRYVVNHAKIATIKSDKFKLLLRGSMNLNHNPRFENFDLTEGGRDYDLVRSIEGDLPVLPDNCSGADAYASSRVSAAFEPEQLAMFKGVKVWAK